MPKRSGEKRTSREIEYFWNGGTYKKRKAGYGILFEFRIKTSKTKTRFQKMHSYYQHTGPRDGIRGKS